MYVCPYCNYKVKSPFNYHEKGDCEEAYKMLVDDLKLQHIPVGSGGHVCLIDVMGDDHAITDAARISYGKGTKQISDDINLIRYLMRHGHMSPFEMASIKFGIKLPIYVFRQIVRHRTAKLNEYSARYSEAIDECELTAPNDWSKQSTNNKQGAGDPITEFPSTPENGAYATSGLTPGEWLTAGQEACQKQLHALYQERLAFGVAREQARKDLPLSNYTEVYWKMDLRNLLGFLSLRMDSHAQRETREFANAIYDIVKQLFPITVKAFDDYDIRRGGMALTRLDIDVIRYLMANTYGRVLAAGITATYGGLTPELKSMIVKNAEAGVADKTSQLLNVNGLFTEDHFNEAIIALQLWAAPPARCRERDECLEKLIRLKVINAN